jgi:hypothetical protein
MTVPFHLSKKQLFPWWFATVVFATGVGFYCLPGERQTAALLFSLLGSIATFFHFLYAQHNSNTDRFIKLFNEFNARFDKLNGDLNRIQMLPTGALTAFQDHQSLYDYFNLCAEEYLYFKAGYVDKEVWSSWLKGMSYFADNEAIRRIWTRELEQGSYYGFSLSLVPKKSIPTFGSKND